MIIKYCVPNLAQDYKMFFMLNSTEHEISVPHKYQVSQNLRKFHAQLSMNLSCSQTLKCQQLLLN